MRFQFLKTILILTVVLALSMAYPVYAWMNPHVVRAVMASGIIALVNILLGYISLEYGIGRSNQVFMVSVFGSMGVRMGLILIAFLVLLLNGYHALALSLSLMGFYIVYMIAEIRYVSREMSRRPTGAAQRRQARRSSDTRTLYALSIEPARD